MASAVSASASFHGFPASFVNKAENSCLRRRMIAAALNNTSARVSGFHFFPSFKCFYSRLHSFFS